MSHRFSSNPAALGGPSRAATAALRGGIDHLVQGAMVDLFAAHDVAVAPLPRSPAQLGARVPEVTAAVTFSHAPGGEHPGKLTLSVSHQLLELMLTRSGKDSSIKLDWACELTNQLTGRIKNRLLPFGIRLSIGTLAIADSQLLESSLRTASNVRVYVGRTLRGEILVTLQGMPEEYKLTYVGTPPPVEGSLILF